MSLEAQLKSALSSLAGGRVHMDTLPATPVFPCFVYQQVGGVAIEFMEGAVADKDHARIQLAAFSKDPTEVSGLLRQARVLLVEGALLATTYGASVATPYDEAVKVFGKRQDFGIWYTP